MAGSNFFNEGLLDLKPALSVPSPAFITPLPNNISPNKNVTSVPSSILRKPPLCSLASFLIVSQTPFNSIPESSRDLINFKRSSISSFEITKVVL